MQDRKTLMRTLQETLTPTPTHLLYFSRPTSWFRRAYTFMYTRPQLFPYISSSHCTCSVAKRRNASYVNLLSHCAPLLLKLPVWGVSASVTKPAMRSHFHAIVCGGNARDLFLPPAVPLCAVVTIHPLECTFPVDSIPIVCHCKDNSPHSCLPRPSYT